nr:hypothetical protein [Tanacetum cinerariifolium]
MKPGVLDVSKEDCSESDDDSWGDSKDVTDDVHDKDDSNDDDDGNDDDSEDYEEEEKDEEYVLTPEKDKSDDDDKMYEEEDDDVIKGLYEDLNITQGLKDADMTNVKQEEDAHVTLMTVHDKTEGTMQSSSVSSDFTSMLLNLDNTGPDVNEIASLMNASNVPPLPPPVNPSLNFTTITQQPTPDSTTTTNNPTMSLLEIPNFASLLKFDQKVSALETKVSEFKQTSQFVDVVSSIPGIVDNYLASKLKEEVNV